MAYFLLLPGGRNGGLDGLRAKIDINLVRPGTRHRQHECGRVPEIAQEGDRTGALWQLVVQFVQLEVDIAELLPDVCTFGELDVYVGDAWQRDRANSIIRSCRSMNRLVLSDRILDGASDKLLNLLRSGARPGTCGQRDPHRYVRIFSLGHARVTEPAPGDHTYQQYPGNVRVLHEEPGNITHLLDLIVAVGCHGVGLPKE